MSWKPLLIGQPAIIIRASDRATQSFHFLQPRLPSPCDRILALSHRLRADGIDCIIDQYVLNPASLRTSVRSRRVGYPPRVAPGSIRIRFSIVQSRGSHPPTQRMVALRWRPNGRTGARVILRVQSYSGRKADERPVRFQLGDYNMWSRRLSINGMGRTPPSSRCGRMMAICRS
jgi:hypothetical protein